LDITVKDISPVEKELQVNVTAGELEPHFEEAYRKEQAKLTIKGFRKGKAPLSIVKKLYGEAIEYDSLSGIASEIYVKAAEEKKLEAIGEPVLTDMNYRRGEDLSFKIKIELKPEIQLQDCRNIPVEKISHLVTEEELDSEFMRLRKANSTTAVAETAADTEHIVTVDVQELDESGTPMIGKKSEGMRVYLADETVVPEVKDALQGASAETTRRVKFELERDGTKHPHHVDFLVKKVEKVEIPPLDDEFVKKVTKDKVQTVNEFRGQMRRDLEADWKNYSDRLLTDTIIGEVVRRHDIPVPQSLVKALTDGRIDEIRNQNPKKELPKEFDEAKFRDEYRPTAIFQAKWYLIREKMIEKEGIAVSDSELEERAAQDAPKMGIEKNRLLSFYKNSPALLDRLKTEKLISFLRSTAAITERTVDEIH
jgi:trigger factor